MSGSLGSSGQGNLLYQQPKHTTQRYTSTCPTWPWTTTQPPSMARLCIKQSKTDPFRQGVEVFLGNTGSEVCPIQALVHYIGVRSPSQGPLFILQSGAPLTRSYLVSQLQAALRQAGIEDSGFNGHSFRIGAATTAAQQGLEDSLIQTLGRWRSDAFKTYIKLPRSQLASVSKTLTQ